MSGTVRRQYSGIRRISRNKCIPDCAQCSDATLRRCHKGGYSERRNGCSERYRSHVAVCHRGCGSGATIFPTVNGLGCVKVLTNTYSVPLPAGAQVQAKAYASTIELWHAGRWVAPHERCYPRQQQIPDFGHYLDVFDRKPCALAGAEPL